MVVPGFAVATEAIPGMTVRVSFIARRVDVNTVMFAQVLGKIVLVKFGIRVDFAAVFTVIHLHFVFHDVARRYTELHDARTFRNYLLSK